jgi:hypothetical protein
LEWGSSVYAKITATNVKGTSDESLPGNGGVIGRVPDAPINLANVPAVTTGSSIGLTWEEGANNGGSPVIDFQVYYALLENNDYYTTLETGVVGTSYNAINLIPG